MTTATKTLPNYTDPEQDGTAYPFAIDATMKVFDRIAGPFAVHEQDTPDMTVAVDAGAIPAVGGMPTEVAATSTGAISAPVANPRYDIVYIDVADGSVGVVAGAEAVAPEDPTVPTGKIAVARLSLAVGMAAITNDVIDDLRVLSVMGLSDGALLPLASQAQAEAGTAADALMNPLRTAQAIAALGAGEDQIARDAAIAALIEANKAGIAGTKGPVALVNPFTSDTLDTSTGAYDAGKDCYTTADPLVEIDYSGSTNIGDMVSYAGLAAAFDGNSNQANTASAAIAGTTGYVGKDWGAGITHTVTKAVITAPNNTGFTQGTANDLDVQIYGSNAAPTAYNDGTLLGSSGVVADAASKVVTLDGANLTSTTAYRYHWAAVVDTESAYPAIAELELYEGGSGVLDATFAAAGGSGALDTADPTDLSAYFLFEFPDADVTVGTNVVGELSIDGGSTQATGSWTKIGDYGTGELWRLDADVSAQTGDNPHWEINTLNNKAVELHACGGILPIYAA